MHTIKINKTPYQVPTSIHEITLGQFYQLKKSKNLLDEVCAVTGMDKMEAMNFADAKDIKAAYALMAPIAKDLQAGQIEGKKLPDKIFMGSKIIPIPKTLNLEPVGAFISVHNIIAEETDRLKAINAEINYTDIIPQVLAHYLFVPYNGGLYNDELVESDAYMQLIMGIRFTQAVPIANFFFRKFPAL